MGRADSPLRDKLIFILGARRSGTWWLQRVVAAHPRVAAVPSESFVITAVERFMESFQHDDRESEQTARIWAERDLLLDSMRDFCDGIFGQFLDGGADRVSERTPWHVRSLDLICDLYPDAYCVHIYRDGRDAARSLRGMNWYAGSLEDAAAEWRDSVTAARASRRPERFFEVRYEDLLREARPVIGGLMSFLDLELDDEVLEAVLAEAATQRNEDPWLGAMAEKWRTVLTDEEQATILTIAGDALVAYGYVSEDEVAAARARHTSLRHRYHRRGRHWRGRG
jgi:hypothetical protein